MYYLLDQPEEYMPIYDASGQDVGKLMAGYNPVVDTENEEAETMLDVMGAKVDLEFSVTEAA
jgi:hypothetical protein